jgi:hypothetical protein
MLVQVTCLGATCKLAELATEHLLLVNGNILIAEENHAALRDEAREVTKVFVRIGGIYEVRELYRRELGADMCSKVDGRILRERSGKVGRWRCLDHFFVRLCAKRVDDQGMYCVMEIVVVLWDADSSLYPAKVDS